MPTPQHSPDRSTINALAALRLIGLLGIAIVIPIIIGVGVGIYIDKLANGHGLILLCCIITGIAAGLFTAYQLILRDLPSIR